MANVLSSNGWKNDLGPLEVGNTVNDGLNAVEQQSAITLWAMANAPLQPWRRSDEA